jgi:hypothetical protein
VPSEGLELLSAKSDGSELWFSGGGAGSGPQAPAEGTVAAPPLLVRYVEPFFHEIPVEAAQFGTDDRFVDVSPVPGVAAAWVADQPGSQQGSSTAKAKVALVQADGSAKVQSLPVSGAGRGSAQLVAATGPEEAWLVTSAGWLFHYSGGEELSEDTDPSWAGTITSRPNESVAQFVADTPPPDDSTLFAPPPVQVETKAQEEPTPEVIPALLKDVKVSRRGLTITISFQLTRLADVQLIAKLHGKQVARTGSERLKPGKRKLSLRLQRKRWPDGLSFKTKELTKPKPVPATEHEGKAKTGPSAVSTSVRHRG